MKPWCAKGEVPTAANLNLYRGWRSCVGWDRDDEPLFGECGDAKLIVSVNFGTSALFRWKGKSCPGNVANSCCLGHGDILVMDGQCQDEFLHRTDPGWEQERINVTFLWVKQHVAPCSFLRTGVACCLPACARVFSVPGAELVEKGGFCWCLVHPGSTGFAGPPLVCTGLVSPRCASCWTRPWSGGRWEHYLCYPWRVCWAAQNTASKIGRRFCDFIGIKLCMLASVGRPSLHCYHACIFFG